MQFAPLRRWFVYCTLVLLTFLVAGCSDPTINEETTLDQIQARGVLRVGTINNQLSYYIGPDGPTGLDYELASMFAERLGVQLEMRPVFGLSGLFPALDRGEFDFVAAGLTVMPSRLERYAPAPAYYFASQVLVYKNGTGRPKSIEQVIAKGGEIVVAANSSHEATLFELQKQYPELNWRTTDQQDGDELLQQVASGELKYTVADSIDVALMQRIYPDVAVALELSEDQAIAWYVDKTRDDGLYALLIEFFGEIQESGELAKLEERYFGHVDSFDYVDTRAFIRAIETTLPRWQPLFEKYSAGRFDWRLIAALAYQESHWNPDAVSPTGVRGLMMLTLATAKFVGVENRLDPEQSIRGGVDYLAGLMKRIPDSIDEHEKVWFALASYNVGFGHVMDARRLTRAQGGNQDSWADVKQRLPLLRKRQYYSQTRYGYARGDEALKYVENIRRYYQSITGYYKSLEPEVPVEVDLDEITSVVVPVSGAVSAAAPTTEAAAESTEQSE
uniref:membrane-bound lytic murein transglycosylase MltF n=1 Tax=Thaumasiovibrio occultus TaxID=1891184 RepID=UPI000B354BB4|nr:membrane-bound lytic murein transglycosylase MltF [Thaumasiovibrio occultus]